MSAEAAAEGTTPKSVDYSPRVFPGKAVWSFHTRRSDPEEHEHTVRMRPDLDVLAEPPQWHWRPDRP